MPLPVAGYYRISVAREDMRAPELYTDEIQRYCAYKKLRLEKVFSDIDRSGFRGAAPRPALEDLVRRRLEFSAVIVPKLARFGRSMKDLVQLFNLFDSDGVSLVFLDMDIDTSTSQGRLLRHIMAAFAEYESDVKADYARANHRLARSEGRPWGLPPFGYIPDRARHTYRISQPEAEMIRYIFRRYAEGPGVSQYRIARELNDAGMAWRDGKPWEQRQVGRILDNPAYAGRCVVGTDLFPAQWEPIVDEEIWSRAREIRESDKRRISLIRAVRRGPYLLSGLLYCGHCRRRLVHRAISRNSRQRGGIYVCVVPGEGKWCPGGSIGSDRADEYVTERFLDRCHVRIEGQSTYAGSRHAWEAASMQQRRALLAMAIRKIVVVPWPGRGEPQRGTRRELRIEWAPSVLDKKKSVLVAEGEREPRLRPTVSEGRSEMMRAHEVAKRADQQRGQSERARAYHASWREVQGRLIESWQTPGDGRPRRVSGA
jgi:DNA invertase Pin-like site-specific DNA recombinase